MILNRVGTKSALASKIQALFPPHKVYLEPFFGAGGMFFNKPKSIHNWINDADDEVFNLFRQLIDNKDELVHWISITPLTQTQFKEWAKGKREQTDVLNAVRFLWLSNMSLYGNGRTLRVDAGKPRTQILQRIDETFEYLQDVYFTNVDFRKFFATTDYKRVVDKSFCYCDPPYLDTLNNYSQGFTQQDSYDLFELLQNTGIKWAMSEFEHPFILEQIKQRNLFSHTIGERQNIKNRRTEILITNYSVQHKLFNC